MLKYADFDLKLAEYIISTYFCTHCFLIFNVHHDKDQMNGKRDTKLVKLERIFVRFAHRRYDIVAKGKQNKHVEQGATTVTQSRNYTSKPKLF